MSRGSSRTLSVVAQLFTEIVRACITATLKKVEVAGFDEMIFYFNIGMRPHHR
jgi:hypothetical protein